MTSAAIRLRLAGTNRRVIVNDGRVYEDLNHDGRISRSEQVISAPTETVAAAESIDQWYELPFSVGAPAVIDPAWVCEGTLNEAELIDFEQDGVSTRRTALQRHLDFFDADTCDGVISVRENWRGWRRLGYGWFRAFLGTVGAAVVFGRPLLGFSIDIAQIDKKRRTQRSGLYDDDGDVNDALLNACLAGFDARTTNDRDQPIAHETAMQIIAQAAADTGHVLGTVSKRQFASLFDLCTRLNHGNKVITANQLVSLFDGLLLYEAASMPASNGRRRGVQRPMLSRTERLAALQ